MSDRRKFLKSIAGALVASAMPKSVLNAAPIVKFHEPKTIPTTGLLAHIEKNKTTIEWGGEAHQLAVKKFNERFEKAIWAGNFNTLNK